MARAGSHPVYGPRLDTHPHLPLIELVHSGMRLGDAGDSANGRSGESGHSHNHSVRIGWGSCRDFEGTLVGGGDVHEIAEQVVTLIFGPREPFNRIGPHINDAAVRQGDQPMLRGTCGKIHLPKSATWRRPTTCSSSGAIPNVRSMPLLVREIQAGERVVLEQSRIRTGGQRPRQRTRR